MWSGFYRLDHITDIDMLKSLYRDAVTLSTQTFCDIKDINYKRIPDPTETPQSYIENWLSLKTHNTIVDRFAYNNYVGPSTEYGEIASCTLGLEYDKFLWIHVSLNDLNKLISKYNLKPWI